MFDCGRRSSGQIFLLDIKLRLEQINSDALITLAEHIHDLSCLISKTSITPRASALFWVIVLLLNERPDVVFGDVAQWPDDCEWVLHLADCYIQFNCHSSEPSVLCHIHEQCCNDVVKVVAKREFVAIVDSGELHELCAPEPRTMDARPGFHVRVANLIFDDVEFDFSVGAELCQIVYVDRVRKVIELDVGCDDVENAWLRIAEKTEEIN